MLSIYMYSSTTTMTMWPPCGNFNAQTVQNYHIWEALHVHMGLANKYVMIFSFPEWVYLLQHNYIQFLETHEYLSMVLNLTRGTSHSSSCTYLWYMSNIWYLLSRNLVAGQSHMLSLVKLCSFTMTCVNTELILCRSWDVLVCVPLSSPPWVLLLVVRWGQSQSVPILGCICWILTHTHTRTHAHTYIHSYACTHAPMHACTRARTHTRTHAYTHTNTHTCSTCTHLFVELLTNGVGLVHHWHQCHQLLLQL